jgi:hypothetical protein
MQWVHSFSVPFWLKGAALFNIKLKPKLKLRSVLVCLVLAIANLHVDAVATTPEDCKKILGSKLSTADIKKISETLKAQSQLFRMQMIQGNFQARSLDQLDALAFLDALHGMASLSELGPALSTCNEVCARRTIKKIQKIKITTGVDGLYSDSHLDELIQLHLSLRLGLNPERSRLQRWTSITPFRQYLLQQAQVMIYRDRVLSMALLQQSIAMSTAEAASKSANPLISTDVLSQMYIHHPLRLKAAQTLGANLVWYHLITAIPDLNVIPIPFFPPTSIPFIQEDVSGSEVLANYFLTDPKPTQDLFVEKFMQNKPRAIRARVDHFYFSALKVLPRLIAVTAITLGSYQILKMMLPATGNASQLPKNRIEAYEQSIKNWKEIFQDETGRPMTNAEYEAERDLIEDQAQKDADRFVEDSLKKVH